MLLFRSCKGAVTVFQTLILISLLALVGVLIDISRVFVAERKVESSLASAARSVIASYNCDLVGDYGLFAVDVCPDNASSRDAFLKYLKLNLSYGDSFKYISYHLDETVDNTNISGFLSLADNEVLKDQIVEYMKYKAPVTITESIVDKFRASGIFNKLEFARKEKIIREKRKELLNEIDKTNSKLEELKEQACDKNLENLKQMLETLKDVQILNDSIASPLEEYYKANEQSRDLVEELKLEDPDIEINVTENSEFDKVRTSSIKLNNEIELNKAEISELIFIVEQLYVEKNELILELEQLKKEQYNVKELMNSINGKIERYYFLKSETDVLKAQIVNLESEVSVLMHSYSENIEKISILENELANLRELMYIKERELMDFEPLPGMESDYENAIDRHSDLEYEIDNLEMSIAQVDSQIFDYINSFEIYGMEYIEVNEPVNDLTDKPVDQNEGAKLTELFESLANKEGSYLRFFTEDMLIKTINQIDSESGHYEPDLFSVSDEKKAEEDNDGIMGFLDGIKMIFNTATEKIFVIEFILDRFTYLTSDVERAHYFHKGEAEYILHGGKKQIDNIVKTLGSVWFLRFAVDSIDHFAVSKNPHPGFRLIYSLGKGFISSCNDMFLLYKGDFINLSPSLKAVKIDYPDHLRIFLLIQSIISEKDQLDNIAQLIHANIRQQDADFDLTKHSTVVYCCVRVEINLWFLPLLHIDRLGMKRFENGRYVIEKETYVGY